MDDKADYDWGREAEQALLKGVLTGSAMPARDFPECDNHIEIQHRDGKPPWCRRCGWNRGRPATPAVKVVNLRRD